MMASVLAMEGMYFCGFMPLLLRHASKKHQSGIFLVRGSLSFGFSGPYWTKICLGPMDWKSIHVFILHDIVL